MQARGCAHQSKMMAKIIGITGGIGSGKTTVCEVFAELGVPVYFADERAKHLMVEDAELMSSIREAFGEQAYANGKLNRPYLAQVVFSSDQALKKLNGLVHPAVARDFLNWATAHRDHAYIVKEAAILFESGAYRAVDWTVLVTAPEKVRIARVMKRDGATELEVRSRMDNQWPEERKAQMADHVIANDGHEPLLPAVLGLHLLFSTETPN